jgi:hypothetical protein
MSYTYSNIHVESPVLKQLTMHLCTGSDLSVSVSAPLLEKVSWRCLYSGAFTGLGIWGLLAARLETEKSNGQLGDDAPRVQVLWLHMFARVCIYVSSISYSIYLLD